MARIAIMAVVALCLLGFFGVLMTRISTPSMALLYSDLSVSDAGAIGQKLDALKIPFQVSPEGTTVRVPVDQVGRARMALAQDGLPKGGSVGNEIFDHDQGFGTTSFMQNLNQVRALEGELARTVSSLSPVHSARIHLVLPKRELFSRDEQPATASVVLQLRPGAQLSHEQVSAIRHLIASAVPQLKPGQVSIIDDRGNLLAKPDDAGGDDVAANNDEQQRAYETRLSHQIEALVGRTVGDGHVRATVTADMDFDRITTSQESYDPDQQVVRSSQETNEKGDSTDSTHDATVSVANNLPGGAKGGGGDSNTNKTSRSEETTNYEIGKTTRNQVREGGQVRKLAIAVLVDGTYETDKDGKQTYQPRSKEEMTQIENIVRSATGYDAKRGDVIDVANMRFAVDPELGTPGTDTSGIMGFAKSDLIHLAETGLIGLVALLVALLVIRPMMSRMTSGVGASVNPNFTAAGLIGSQGPAAALSAPTAGNLETMGMGANDFGPAEDAINFDQVEGRVRASSLKKIGEIVDKHPSEAVSIIRGWMYQEKAT
jgi:flagellar M-ring protein FliF